MSYCAYITRIKDVRSHSNADKLMIGNCFGNSIIIGNDIVENDLVVYFPTDGRLGIEFATINRLIRTKDENGNHIYGYLDADKRHVTTIKLRGEYSDGLVLSINSLNTFTDTSKLKEGDTISVLNGVVICEKYVPKRNISNRSENGSIKKEKTIDSYPLFIEHVDTQQFAYNKDKFQIGDLIYITLKIHGTSHRITRTIKQHRPLLPDWAYKCFKFVGIKINPKISWEYVSGSRRVILKNFEEGSHGGNNFRKKWHDYFIGKLHKGECVYLEIAGYMESNRLIMPSCDNKKTNDKEFIKQYGNTTNFTYGCNEGENRIFVYRMNMTNEDGFVIEYSTEQTIKRCEQMGIDFVPIFDKFFFTSIEDLEERINKFVDGADPIGLNHVREGIVIRIENKNKFVAYKHKNNSFKLLEGIIKASDILDIEEEQSNETNILSEN